MTNGIRVELVGRPILVQGVHLGGADTDMMAGIEGPKIDPADVARSSLAGIEAGLIEVLVDDPSRFVKTAFGKNSSHLYGWDPRRRTAHVCHAINGSSTARELPLRWMPALEPIENLIACSSKPQATLCLSISCTWSGGFCRSTHLGPFKTNLRRGLI